MRRLRFHGALAGLAAMVTFAALAFDVPVAQAAVIPDCTAAAPTSADAAFAARVGPTLTGKLRGSALTPSRVACARLIVQVVKARRLPVRAATIALTTAIVESTIQNLPYGDRDSLGLYQQRPSTGWGTQAQILDPVYSTNSFLTKMERYPWQTAPVGEICQAVQISGTPDAYQPQAADGERLATALWGAVSSALADYDGDGSTDLALYRRDPVNGSAWWVQSPSTEQIILADHHYGGSADIPAPGDYDGDGVADLALYRRDCVNGSAWWIKSGRDRTTQIKADFKYGGCADIPAPGDYNGDGVTDLALYRQDCTNGSSWSIYDVKNSSAIRSGFKYGGCKDIPAPGDYNGNGSTDLALYRQDCTNGSSWSIYDVKNSSAIRSGFKYGGCGDIPAPGDYNGDKWTDLALYRQDCTNGSSWSIYNLRLSGAIQSGLKYGGCKDIPAPGDYNGNGSTDLALYRQDCTNGSTWWIFDIVDVYQIRADHHFGGCADIPATA
ncbi:FG-GAP repeat domain-containing protein [Micromonospora sp. DT43]|uniref:FG-GAP repeat domain-containing protein n=1 Tax=Micromonospora sp. DT43 TaxID=3393440 RepID=UPI003CEBA6EC